MNNHSREYFEMRLLEAAENLHMAYTGASDCPSDVLANCAEAIRGRLRNWKVSGRAYDSALRSVLEIALTEYDEMTGRY